MVRALAGWNHLQCERTLIVFREPNRRFAVVTEIIPEVPQKAHDIPEDGRRFGNQPTNGHPCTVRQPKKKEEKKKSVKEPQKEGGRCERDIL